MADNSEHVSALWNSFRNQHDWMRHNEDQRAKLTTLLLAVATALVAVLPKDRLIYQGDWPIPAFMILVGTVGLLAVIKYWERFGHHSDIGWAYLNALDEALERGRGPYGEGAAAADAPQRLADIFQKADAEHDERMCHLLVDKRLKQHWIWAGLFLILALFGTVLLRNALANGPAPLNVASEAHPI